MCKTKIVQSKSFCPAPHHNQVYSSTTVCSSLIPPLISLTTRGAVGGRILGFGAFLMTIAVSFNASEINSSLTFCTLLTCEGGVSTAAFHFLAGAFDPTFFGAVEVATLVRFLPVYCEIIFSKQSVWIATATECWHKLFHA